MTSRTRSAPHSRLAAAALLVMATVLAFTLAMVPDSSTSRANALFSWNNANVTHVAVGNEHTCAIQNGVLFCWGAGTGGQLGYLPPARPPVLPQARDQLVPVRVSPASGFLNSGSVTAVSAGGAVTCAIENGILYCWGSNGVAQIGIGTFTSSVTTPRKVSAANGFQNSGAVTAVSVDGSGVCALEGGVAYCWGANGLGAVGNGQRTDVSVPHPSVPQKVQPTGDFANSGVTAIARANTTCAVEAGEVFCWGAGSSGEMGNGTLTQANLRPVKVGSGTDGFSNNNVVDVSTGGVGVCATRNEGANRAMYCWGNGGAGNLGFGVQVLQQTTPRKVMAMKGANPSVSSITTGLTSCAVDDGTLYCFGNNWNGQIGDGTTTQRFAPVRVSSTGGMPNVAVTMVAAENGFAYHTCAIEGGSAYCWGKASKGQLGNEETSPDRLFPVAAASTPGAPTITAATVGTTTATFTLAAGAGGVATSFTVTAQPGGLTCTVTPPATGCTIEGLTPGTHYTFSATASSDKGTSPASAGVTRTTGATAVPGTPEALAGNGALTVTVSAGSGGGTPTGYIATASPGGATCTVTPPATTCVISPLTNGTTYTVTTAAFNDAGPSNDSNSVSVVVGPPAPPQQPTVVVGFQSATVSVSPTTSGGTPASYTVTAQPGGATCRVTPPDTDCVITGLTNGVDYTFTTTATNGGGTSDPGPGLTALVDVLPIPLKPAVVVDATGVTVSVSTDPSGGTVQSHVVYLEPGGHTCAVNPPTTSACFISGLTQPTEYTVTTAAMNGIGTSSASPALVFDFDVPGVPGVGALSIATGTMTVTVSAGSPGGPPSSYEVFAGPGSCTVTPPATSCVITGLADQQTYTVTASATNGLGTTSNSAGVPVGLVAPDDPPAPTMVVGNGSATITVVPATTGGIPATYLVVARPGNRTCTVTTPASSCTISGLTNGVVYTVTTSAANDFGTSSSSATTSALVDVLPVPLEPSVVIGSGGVTVSVSTSPGGGTVQTHDVVVQPGGHMCTVTPPATSCFVPLPSNGTYTVTSSATNGLGSSNSSPTHTFLFEGPEPPVINGVVIGLGQVTVSVSPTTSGGAPSQIAVFAGPGSCTVVPPASSCSIAGLAGGQSYTVTASAINGAGAATNTTGLEARLIPPDAPPVPVTVIGDGSLTVYVVPPDGGETPSNYTVMAQPGNHTCTVTPPAVSCELSSLTNGTEYSVTVTASNAYGPSEPSVALSALVAEPATPLAPSVTPGDGRATVTVRPGTGGGAASAFIVNANPDDVSCEVLPPATSCVLEGLTNGTEYTVTVIAANGVGNSTVSALARVTPEEPRVVLPPGIGGLVTSPVPTTVPPTTTPTTRPPTTTPPTTTVPPAVDPATGVLPELEPGASTVIVDGEAVPVEVTAVSPTEVVVASPGFELRLVAECSSLCEVATNADGQPVIQLEPTGGVRVTGTGFLPGSVAYVWLFSEPRLLGTVTVNADGTFTGVLPVGALEAGEHTLQVNGTSATGATRVANLGVLVNEAGVPSPVPGRLPTTGNGASSTLLTWAVVLMLLGSVAFVRRRPLAR